MLTPTIFVDLTLIAALPEFGKIHSYIREAVLILAAVKNTVAVDADCFASGVPARRAGSVVCHIYTQCFRVSESFLSSEL